MRFVVTLKALGFNLFRHSRRNRVRSRQLHPRDPFLDQPSRFVPAPWKPNGGKGRVSYCRTINNHMRGICGIVGYRHDGDLTRMAEILSHRGPDNIGVKVFDNDRVALGHTRLSILDPSPRDYIGREYCGAGRRATLAHPMSLYDFDGIRQSAGDGCGFGRDDGH